MKKSRHGYMANGMRALLAYRNRPEGKQEQLKTNWTTIPTNDNASPDEIADFGHERSWRMTPSIKAIAREMHKEPVVVRGHTVAIGKLRFSDGTQTEKAYMLGPEGAVIQYDARMPAGAMLGTRDKPEATLGGGVKQSDITASNSYFADVFCTDERHYKAGKKRKKRETDKSYTPAESQAMLDAAIANTEELPPVTICPPGLPLGSAAVAESFVGMKKGRNGDSASIAWEDIATSIVQREVWEQALSALSDNDKAALDASCSAAMMEDVGIAIGQSRKYARYNGGGRRALIAANNNLTEAIRKYSS